MVRLFFHIVIIAIVIVLSIKRPEKGIPAEVLKNPVFLLSDKLHLTI